ncbi:TetR/AcrR family transcriptional regulator C-terminal domain-containing protein [Nocardia sp. X0981]
MDNRAGSPTASRRERRAGSRRPLRRVRRIGQLPAERFPGLLEIARVAAAGDPEAEFRAGLRIVLAGLRADH